MGRNYVFTNSSASGVGAKKRTIGRKFTVGPKAIRFVSVIIFGAMAMIYLTQTTNGAGQSMEMRELSSQKSQLTDEYERLKIEESRLESLNQINQAIASGSSAEANQTSSQTSQTNLTTTNTVNNLPSKK